MTEDKIVEIVIALALLVIYCGWRIWQETKPSRMDEIEKWLHKELRPQLKQIKDDLESRGKKH